MRILKQAEVKDLEHMESTTGVKLKMVMIARLKLKLAEHRRAKYTTFPLLCCFVIFIGFFLLCQ